MPFKHLIVSLLLTLTAIFAAYSQYYDIAFGVLGLTVFYIASSLNTAKPHHYNQSKSGNHWENEE